MAPRTPAPWLALGTWQERKEHEPRERPRKEHEHSAGELGCRRQFKIRAVKVKEDLESFVPGVSVVINPEKPRRGCLEIREEGGEVFISLLNMPRPFTAMKKLDMDEVIKEIAK
uniref:Uncharacterized protein n=1 Tax=Oryza nivara TaxID=4536 RepID=A0A0E0HBG5_ORYNI